MRYRLKKLYVTVIRDGPPPSRTLNGPEEVARLALDLMRAADDDREHFWLVCLDARNHCLGHFEVAIGGVSASPVDPRVIFRQALLAGAVNLVAIHNHPSGDPTPSRDDRVITQKLVQGAELLDLGFHDHIIVGNGTERWISMAQCGLITPSSPSRQQ